MEFALGTGSASPFAQNLPGRFSAPGMFCDFNNNNNKFIQQFDSTIHIFPDKSENIGIVEGEGQKQSLCKATCPNVQVLRY
jgi:hypothetical protein